MEHFGFQILQALITDLDPDQRVKNAMNEINSSKVSIYPPPPPPHPPSTAKN